MAPPHTYDIPSLPLSCMQGDHPDDVPILDAPTCRNNDDRDQKAEKAYRDVYEQSRRHLWPEGSTEERTLDRSVPVQLFRQGFPGLTHPFWEIALRADRYVEDDFRSGKAFEAAATSDTVIQLAERRHRLIFLYPASGSHLTDLLIPLKLIDRGSLDSAEIIHTEIDPNALNRVDGYLKFFEKNGLIQNLAWSSEAKTQGFEGRYEFQYKKKWITLIFGVNRGGDVYAPDEYIQKSDLIIFHDGVYNSPNDNTADAFFKKLETLSHDERFGKDRFVLSENQWNCPKDGFVCRIKDQLYDFETIDGVYGCTLNHSLDVPHYVEASEPGSEPSLKKMPPPNGPLTKVHYAPSDISPQQAVLIQVDRKTPNDMR